MTDSGSSDDAFKTPVVMETHGVSTAMSPDGIPGGLHDP